MVALRQLTYGLSADALDDYFRVGESTAMEGIKVFCRYAIMIYEPAYLRSPNGKYPFCIKKHFAAVAFHGVSISS